jgi:hypothetical protein
VIFLVVLADLEIIDFLLVWLLLFGEIGLSLWAADLPEIFFGDFDSDSSSVVGL